MNNESLKGKNIIITGASQGLGEYCAIKMSQKGANIILISRSKEKLKRVLNQCNDDTNNLIVQLDITDHTQCTDKLNDVIENYNADKVYLNS